MQPSNHPQPSNPDAKSYLIIVMGVSGSGKSTLAKALASHYGYHYFDGDNFHSQEARDHMAQGLPLDDAMRLPWVMRMRDHFSALANEGQNSTLAFSGLKHAHRDELRKAGLKTLFLFLHSDIGTIQHRVDNRAGHFMAPSLVANQFDSLERPTNETDVVDIDVRAPLDEVIQQAIHIIDNYLLNTAQTQSA
jgi:gluconokinase